MLVLTSTRASEAARAVRDYARILVFYRVVRFFSTTVSIGPSVVLVLRLTIVINDRVMERASLPPPLSAHPAAPTDQDMTDAV